MLNKIFSFLGFNSSETLIGLSQLNDNTVKPVKINLQQTKKELKLSDLMRGN